MNIYSGYQTIETVSDIEQTTIKDSPVYLIRFIPTYTEINSSALPNSATLEIKTFWQPSTLLVQHTKLIPAAPHETPQHSSFASSKFSKRCLNELWHPFW
jgi:hypothetical protein